MVSQYSNSYEILTLGSTSSGGQVSLGIADQILRARRKGAHKRGTQNPERKQPKHSVAVRVFVPRSATVVPTPLLEPVSIIEHTV